MTIAIPDFSHLTSAQFVAILIAISLVDLLTGVLGALRAHTFNADEVLTFLDTHGVRRILPIAATFAVGSIGGVFALVVVADGLLAAYFVETIASSVGNISPPAP